MGLDEKSTGFQVSHSLLSEARMKTSCLKLKLSFDRNTMLDYILLEKLNGAEVLFT